MQEVQDKKKMEYLMEGLRQVVDKYELYDVFLFEKMNMELVQMSEIKTKLILIFAKTFNI